MKQNHNRWFYAAFLLVIVIYIAFYLLHKTVSPPLIYDLDITDYSASLLKIEYPELYTEDPIYADGVVPRMFWASAYLYMRLFQVLHTLTGENISHTVAYLQLIPCVLSIMTFYWCLRTFRFDQWTTLAVSVCLSLFMLMLRYNGVLSIYYYAVIPIFLRLLWDSLFEPSFFQKPVTLSRVILIGFVIGISPALINSVNGLAFCLLTLGLASLQWAIGKMKLSTYVALLIGLVPIFALISLGGTGGARLIITDFAAQAMIPTMTLPQGPWQLYLGTGLVTAVSALWLWYRPSRTSKFAFLLASWSFWFIPFGTVTIFFFIYFLIRLLRRQDEILDHMLMTALHMSILIGPVLFGIVGAVWSITQIHLLVFIMWQMFRFHLLGHFFGAVILLHMVVYFTKSISDVWIQRLTQCGILILYVNMVWDTDYRFLLLIVLLLTLAMTSQMPSRFQLKPLLQRTKIVGGAVLVGAITLATFILTRNGAFPGYQLAVLMAIVLLYTFFLVTGVRHGGWSIAIALLTMMWGIAGMAFTGFLLGVYDTQTPYISLSDHEIEQYHDDVDADDQLMADFIDVTGWVRNNTPLDSLIYHYQTRDVFWFFRYMTRRAHLFSRMDQVVGLYSPKVAERNHQIYQAVTNTKPEFILWAVAKYDVDYVVFPKTEPLLYPAWYDNKLILPVPIYQNTTYDVYIIQTAPIGPVIKVINAFLSSVTKVEHDI